MSGRNNNNRQQHNNNNHQQREPNNNRQQRKPNNNRQQRKPNNNRQQRNERQPYQDPLQIPADQVENLIAWFDSIIRHRVNDLVNRANIPNFDPKPYIDRGIQDGWNDLVEVARDSIPDLIEAIFADCLNAAGLPPQPAPQQPATNAPPQPAPPTGHSQTLPSASA